MIWEGEREVVDGLGTYCRLSESATPPPPYVRPRLHIALSTISTSDCTMPCMYLAYLHTLAHQNLGFISVLISHPRKDMPSSTNQIPHPLWPDFTLSWLNNQIRPRKSEIRRFTEYVAGAGMVQVNEQRRNQQLPVFEFATIL